MSQDTLNTILLAVNCVTLVVLLGQFIVYYFQLKAMKYAAQVYVSIIQILQSLAACRIHL